MFSATSSIQFSFTLNTISYITHLKNGREKGSGGGGDGGGNVFNRPQKEGTNRCSERTHICSLKFTYIESELDRIERSYKLYKCFRF